MKDASVIAKELSGTFPRPAHAKVEDDRSAEPAVLELIGLVVAPLVCSRSKPDRGFIRLDVSAFEQIAFKNRRHGKQQFARSHDGRVERAARDFDSVVSLQIGGLPVKRQMGEVFLDEHVDKHSVGSLPFSTILGPRAAAVTTPPSGHLRQASFSRLITRTK